MAAVSRGTSHVTTKQRFKYTTSMDIQKPAIKRQQSLIQNYLRQERSESARQQRTALYKKRSTTTLYFRAQELCESGGGRPGLPSLTVRMVSVDVKQQ